MAQLAHIAYHYQCYIVRVLLSESRYLAGCWCFLAYGADFNYLQLLLRSVLLVGSWSKAGKNGWGLAGPCSKRGVSFRRFYRGPHTILPFCSITAIRYVCVYIYICMTKFRRRVTEAGALPRACRPEYQKSLQFRNCSDAEPGSNLPCGLRVRVSTVYGETL